MRYEYTNTIDNYVIAENNKFLFEPKKVFWDIIFPIILYPLVSLLVALNCFRDGYITFAILLILVSILLATTAIFRAPMVRRKKFHKYFSELFEKNEHMKSKKILTIQDENVNLLFSNGNEFNIHVFKIKKVILKHDTISLYTNDYGIFTVIPCSIFKTDIEKNKLLNLLNKKKPL
ncbi:MAG: hypothetical protein ACRCXT_06960 [Paraclostridium sp.]